MLSLFLLRPPAGFGSSPGGAREGATAEELHAYWFDTGIPVAIDLES
jgi:hypothetical protein